MFSLVTRNYTSRRVIGFGSDWIDLNRYPYPVTFIRFRFGSDRLWIFESPIHMRFVYNRVRFGTCNYTIRLVDGSDSDWIDLNRYSYPFTFIGFRSNRL